MKIPTFAIIWIILGSILGIWDALFVLTRPMSMKDGSLFWLFTPYDTYVQLDPSYADLQNPFVLAITYLNCIEIALGLISLVIYRYTPHFRDSAVILLLLTSMATLSKTALYLLHDHLLGSDVTNMSTSDYLSYFLVPNTTWILLPTLCIYSISRQIIGRQRLKLS